MTADIDVSRTGVNVVKIHSKWLLSFTLTIVLAEAGLRLYGHAHPSLFSYNPSRYLKFKARPGDLSYGFPINSNGFKDKSFGKARAPGEFRVAAIGDSFVFSMVPYEHSFCTEIEKCFTNVNVMNFGVIGTAPDDYVTVLKKDVLEFAPDEVIVFIYVGNDFLPTRRRWYEYAALTTVVHHSIKVLQSYKGQDIRQNYAYHDDMTPFSYADFVSMEARCAETYYADADQFRKQFDRTMLSLCAMRDVCSRSRIRFRVVALPDRLQLDSALQGDVARHLRKPLASFDYLRPQRMLAEALTAKDIPFLDLYKPFSDDSKRKFINNDIHLNLYGNSLVAKSMPADWFERD